MKVTRIFVSLLLLAAVTGVASAQPSFSVYWDVCANTATPANENKDYTGPGIYKQIVSGQNFNGGVRGQQVVMLLGSPGGLGDAWRFDADGCNVGQVSFSTAALSKTCPKLEGTQPLALTQYGYDSGTGKAAVNMANTFDTFNAVLGTTYTLWQISYDHAFSAPGPQDPAVACGNVERPVCVHGAPGGTGGARSSWLDANDNTFDLATAHEHVNWQDAANLQNCPGATAAQPSTWGAIKNQYHR